MRRAIVGGGCALMLPKSFTSSEHCRIVKLALDLDGAALRPSWQPVLADHIINFAGSEFPKGTRSFSGDEHFLLELLLHFSVDHRDAPRMEGTERRTMANGYDRCAGQPLPQQPVEAGLCRFVQ
jgi:hypothetical protein